MAEEPFEIGAEVSCSDGTCGELSRVVVNPVARTITHLVVEPEHGRAPGRLVPVELAQAGSDGIRLNCTKADFDRLDPADETQLRPASGWPGLQGYGSEQVLSWRYYGLSTGDGTGLDSSAGPGRGRAVRESATIASRSARSRSATAIPSTLRTVTSGWSRGSSSIPRTTR